MNNAFVFNKAKQSCKAVELGHSPSFKLSGHCHQSPKSWNVQSTWKS